MKHLSIIMVAMVICFAQNQQTISTSKSAAKATIAEDQAFTSEVFQSLNQYLQQLRAILPHNPQCAQQALSIVIQIENLFVLLPSSDKLTAARILKTRLVNHKNALTLKQNPHSHLTGKNLWS